MSAAVTLVQDSRLQDLAGNSFNAAPIITAVTFMTLEAYKEHYGKTPVKQDVRVVTIGGKQVEGVVIETSTHEKEWVIEKSTNEIVD